MCSWLDGGGGWTSGVEVGKGGVTLVALIGRGKALGTCC